MNKPNRTIAADALIENLTLCMANIEDYKDDPTEVNCALAFCELAVSIPPDWFTKSERVLVADLIQALYGNPVVFIDNLSQGNVSYYNKMIAVVNANGEKAKELDEAVLTMLRMHIEEFNMN
jgi:regulator of sigma D